MNMHQNNPNMNMYQHKQYRQQISQFNPMMMVNDMGNVNLSSSPIMMPMMNQTPNVFLLNTTSTKQGLVEYHKNYWSFIIYSMFSSFIFITSNNILNNNNVLVTSDFIKGIILVLFFVLTLILNNWHWGGILYFISVTLLLIITGLTSFKNKFQDIKKSKSLNFLNDSFYAILKLLNIKINGNNDFSITDISFNNQILFISNLVFIIYYWFLFPHKTVWNLVINGLIGLGFLLANNSEIKTENKIFFIVIYLSKNVFVSLYNMIIKLSNKTKSIVSTFFKIIISLVYGGLYILFNIFERDHGHDNEDGNEENHMSKEAHQTLIEACFILSYIFFLIDIKENHGIIKKIIHFYFFYAILNCFISEVNIETILFLSLIKKIDTQIINHIVALILESIRQLFKLLPKGINETSIIKFDIGNYLSNITDIFEVVKNLKNTKQKIINEIDISSNTGSSQQNLMMKNFSKGIKTKIDNMSQENKIIIKNISQSGFSSTLFSFGVNFRIGYTILTLYILFS